MTDPDDPERHDDSASNENASDSNVDASRSNEEAPHSDVDEPASNLDDSESTIDDSGRGESDSGSSTDSPGSISSGLGPAEDEVSGRTAEYETPRETASTRNSRSAVEYLELAAVVGLLVLAAIATIGFYTSTSSAIDRLITPDYEPMFQAAFNLLLLLIALIGLSELTRRRFDLA